MGGLAVAATWIDTIAGQLVDCLSFVGGLADIPVPVLGLTVVAWGNSVGDLFTNLAMTKKGLGNMALTACFGGPVFNILVGMGLGFTQRLPSDNGKLKVDPQPGLWFGMACCVA